MKHDTLKHKPYFKHSAIFTVVIVLTSVFFRYMKVTLNIEI